MSQIVKIRVEQHESLQHQEEPGPAPQRQESTDHTQEPTGHAQKPAGHHLCRENLLIHQVSISAVTPVGVTLRG